ncbi:iron uptake system protein EfeO [Segeticoccus rhizosphaerae]|jgi:iron uptake system component EfeO|uniref:iron uptake system protein EfeO n=1 Tax=Segeticoccus rhizosphaerae TaxID=1104777 RepID=UPI0012647114|nr:iron uptake system protein EfeO [Segeticoccus rhizosphaerae]
MKRRLVTSSLALAVAVPLMAACTSNSPSSEGGGTDSPREMAVTSTNDACDVSAQKAPSGSLVFNVKNDGSKVTEFYLLAEDGLRIIGEVENIGPGLTRDLVVKAPPGDYFTACKPGMVGDGIRDAFTVTDSGEPAQATGKDAELVKAANEQYASYVKDQTEQLLAKTRKFVSLYEAGKDEQARALYADARVHWERIEPVAESFGDLDPKMDLREADLQEGQKWTGWHRIEKDLWPPKSGYQPMTDAQRTAIADQLLKDTKDLYQRTRTITFTADQIGNGAKGLLDEVATGKVTGEEEIWSHTDLWDFQANVDGARVAWEGLRPLLKKDNPELDRQIDRRFTALQDLLDAHRKGDGFVSYTELDKTQVRKLSDAVNALSEPLSKLTAAVTL